MKVSTIIDSLIAIYVCQWLELPISATFSSLIIPKSKYGINFLLPSIKFLPCQTVIRNALKSSPNLNINSLWAQSSLDVRFNTISTRTQSKLLMPFKKITKAVSLNHKVFSSPSFLLKQIPKLAIFGLQLNRACSKTFLTFQSSVLIDFYPNKRRKGNNLYLMVFCPPLDGLSCIIL